ncbi:amino acid adenylation domain-containing protein [Lysobacter sp. 5GHs7-4]|uniref:non-ribosomal peptide synthetase n=1 Tax=Lysobacter sp. 5GHs7-4 TaxID=2904253 RepID=UPI001E6415E8|nr:non-ribosomal peptide synthetase [Lysobacter sp. 5GHs7-4]UHQ22824.1 amino acid adenylation domain-containing protein [Lysobacter sp. 5GHs7-4]
MNDARAVSLPLSVAQLGLWFSQKIAGPGANFNLAEAIEINGWIDPGLFLRALRQVSSEADAVRVRLIDIDGVPRQRVVGTRIDAFPYFDYSDQADPAAAAEAWMRSELRAQADLDDSPLWVCALFKLADERHVWYHRAHHIVLDGYAGGLIARRVAEIYSAYALNREPEPAGFHTLASLLEAEDGYRASDRCRRDREYWHEQLAELPEPVTLSRRSARGDGGLRRATGFLSADSSRRLRELGRQCAASLPQVLIALVAAYYYRATGAADLVLGMPVSGRVNHQLRHTPGMLANAVLLRLRMSPTQTVAELIAQVARVVAQALRHQRYRYEDLRRELGLVGQGQRVAWLGVNIEPFDYALDFGGASGEPRNLSNGTAEDLTVFVYDRGDDSGLRFDFDANPALYDDAELAEHCRRLQRLIDAALDDPAARLCAIDVLGEDERGRLLRQGNGTAAPLPTATVPALFAEQAWRSPEAIAVCHGERRLSYRELHVRSLHEANRLIECGVTPGGIVAMALPRDENLLVAMLAIGFAGAAYLPLDPDAPDERIAQMLEDAAPTLLLTSPTLAPRLARLGTPVTTLAPDARAYAISAPRAFDLSTLQARAYVLYTSGSTGRPKGVEVGHDNLSNLLEAMRRQLRPLAADRFLAVSTVIFDVAALELFLPLIVGARTVIAGADIVRDPPRLAALIREHGIGYMQATPSLWRMLLSSGDTDLSGVHALAAGEALPGELAQRLAGLADRVSNLYGPTETSVYSTAIELSATDLAAPPIGRPLLNTRVYVLDDSGGLVPGGCPGELYIAGAGVARGYLNRPELTAQRFLPDPFDARGGRMYRSGDRVRWREDGVLEYLGRNDQQIKIRGIRVEPGEIESQLMRHAAVAEAAVVAEATGGEGGMRLLAYLVPRAGAAIDTDALRRHLAQSLPDYMMPSALMALPALPLTPSGKLDRKALPAPQRGERNGFVAPRTAEERKLAAIWKELLGLPRIGVHDNFFELGGDSLIAAQLIARLPERFGKRLPVASLFEASTIAGLAALLARTDHEHGDPLGAMLTLRAAPPGRAAPLRPLFCIHPIAGLSLGYSGLLRHLDPALPVYGLQSRGLRGLDRLPDSIDDIADDYLAQIRRLQPQGPYRLLGRSLGGLIGHAIAARLHEQGERVELLAMIDSYLFAPAAPARDPAQEARAALDFLGIATGPGPAPGSLDELAPALLAHNVRSMPLLREIARDHPRFVEHAFAVMRNNLALARRHAPRRLDLDLVYFHANQRLGDPSALIEHDPETWRPYVGGRFELHALDCHHEAVLDAQPAARIGRVLRQHLALLQPASVSAADDDLERWAVAHA